MLSWCFLMSSRTYARKNGGDSDQRAKSGGLNAAGSQIGPPQTCPLLQLGQLGLGERVRLSNHRDNVHLIDDGQRGWVREKDGENSLP